MPDISGLQRDTKKYIRYRGFQTMDTQSAREALDPTRLAWCENLEIVGPNQLVCCQGPAPALVNIPSQLISSQFSATFGNADYIMCFTESGAGYQVSAITGALTQIAPNGTFSAAPDCTVWSSKYLLIADASAGYCVWDGHVFVQSGGVSPSITITNGGSYGSVAPTVTISGGSGSGNAAHAVLTNGVVTSVVLDAPGIGYQPADTLTVTFGSGTAAATAKVWPTFSASPTTLAIYAGRVWLAATRLLAWTGTQGFDDAAPANAAGNTTLNDADLAHSITALRSLNNFLYIFGDNSIKQIGTVTVSGSTTNFAIVTLSSDQGTPFPRAIASYNRLILFANKVGVYAILGASVEKVSDQMDGIFPLMDTSQPLQAAIQDLHSSLHTFLILCRYRDPAQARTRSLILCFTKNRWFVASQGDNLISICTASINGLTETFASSGSDVTQIFQSAVPVNVLLKTALSDNGADIGKRMLQCAVALTATTALTVNLLTESENGSTLFQLSTGTGFIWLNNAGAVVSWVNNSGQTVEWLVSGFVYQRSQAAATGVYIGMTLYGSFPGAGSGGGPTGLIINGLVAEYQDTKVFASKMSA
jgi:hypothetical protein